MNKLERMLNDLCYNKSIINKIMKHEIHCAIWSEEELDLLAEIYDCSVDDIKADKIIGIDVYRHADGRCEYFEVEV